MLPLAKTAAVCYPEEKNNASRMDPVRDFK